MTADGDNRPEGGSAPLTSAYTRSPMETGTLGSKRRLELDAVTVEAQAALDAAAERLRALSEDLRVAYEEAAGEGSDVDPSHDLQPDATALAPARALLGRLDMAGQQLRRVSASLKADRGEGRAAPASSGPLFEDPAAGVAILSAQEEERSRLAAELHDGPAQAISNAILQTEVLGNALRSDAHAAEGELISLRQLLHRELDKLRAYINQLRPSLVDAQGLEDGLRDSAAQLSARTGVPIDVRLNAASTDLGEPERAVALRVGQEALRNVAKHASPTRVWVTTKRDAAGRWLLEIGDDGQGFDVAELMAQPSRRHFGLRFMRERAELLGADLSIEAAPSAGTVVRLSISTTGGDGS